MDNIAIVKMGSNESPFIRPLSYGGSYKITVIYLSVSLSVRPLVRRFSQEWLIIFFDFWHDGRYLKYLKADRGFFPRTLIFAQIWVRRAENFWE